MTHLMKITATPFRCMFTRMSIEDGEETLTANVVKIDYERVCIFHGTPGTLVLRYTDLIRGVLRGMSIEDLRWVEN